MIILPPYYPQFEVKPLLFLAGPIQGAPDWHVKAINRLHKINLLDKLHVACPKKGVAETNYTPGYYTIGSGEFAQYDWETHFLNKTAENGVILFWCAKEETHYCDRAYGQTTRWELAEWKERARVGKVNLVIGIESGWTGERYMRRRLSQDLPEQEIHTTLGGTLKEALHKLKMLKSAPTNEPDSLDKINKAIDEANAKGLDPFIAGMKAKEEA